MHRSLVIVALPVLAHAALGATPATPCEAPEQCVKAPAPGVVPLLRPYVIGGYAAVALRVQAGERWLELAAVSEDRAGTPSGVGIGSGWQSCPPGGYPVRSMPRSAGLWQAGPAAAPNARGPRPQRPGAVRTMHPPSPLSASAPRVGSSAPDDVPPAADAAPPRAGAASSASGPDASAPAIRPSAGAGSPDASLAADEGGAPGSGRNGLSYPFEAPENGHSIEVAPGVRWIRMALPMSLNHINLWAVADGDGWTLVDTGMQTAETASAWRRLLAEDLAPGRPTRIIATHMHPDHVGMAGWLARKFDIPLCMTRLEYLTCRVLVADTGRPAPADGERFYRRAGWDEEAIEQYRARFGGFGKAVHALPDSYRRLRDRDVLRIGAHDWQVIVGTGHSPEHACLYSPEAKLLISGDQVLPKISSNVSVFPTEPDADPLGDWLASIELLRRDVPDDVLVLPAHNEPFRGLHARLERLAAGHARGLSRLRDRLAEPRRVVDVFGSLFARPITGTSVMGLATGEALAHLNHLLVRGEAVRETDAQGVDWYRATPDGLLAA